MPVTQLCHRDAGWSHWRRHSLWPASERNHNGSASSDSGVQTAHCWKGRLDSLLRMFHTHCSILSLWLSWALHTLLHSPLCFRWSQPPKFSQLVPATFLFSVHLRGMTFPFLSDRNPLWTPSHQTWRHFFSQNCRPATFSILCWCLHLSLHLCLLPVLSCV